MNRRTFNLWAGLSGLDLLSQRFALASVSSQNDRGAGIPTNVKPETRSGYMLGTSYYPEWWDAKEWEEDFAQMSALGLNTVRMGEFAWAAFEPEQGRFSFDWMDHAIDIANHHGIRVILGTPTASVPPWLYQLYPDVLGASAVQPYSYGGRKGYCTNSANYLVACAEITTGLARHYGQHTGVIGWQLDNEPGIPFECLDQNCEHAFQGWLEKRYGSLDALNRAWNGAFWSNKYSAWSQIHFPKNSAEGGWQPAITLDYRKFFSDSYLHHLRNQAEILQSHTRDQFISTNWPSVTWSVDVYTAGAEFLDMTAWDNYCSAPGLTDYRHQYISCMNHDMSRSASRGQRFFCAEQIAYLPPNALPEALRLQAYLNLAHGSRGHLYFEWRRPLAGNEQSRPSFIKRFDGKINPAKPVFERLGKEFAELGPKLAEAVTTSDVALLYDFTNEFAQGFWSVGERTDRYDAEASRFYAGLKSLQRNIDIVPITADLSGYKVLAAPNLRLIDDAMAKKLEKYVASGGVLILSPRAGTQNTDCSMRRDVSPGVFTTIAGVSAESKLDLVEYSSARGQMDTAQEAELGIAFTDGEAVFRPRTIMESLILDGAEPVASFRGGRMQDRPAVVRHRYKAGWVIYAGTDSADHGFHEALAQLAAQTASLQPLVEVPPGVAVTTREDERQTYYFVLNLTETPHDGIGLPTAMDDWLNGRPGVRAISLEPLGVALLSVAKDNRDKR
jgi:beta-galactosidase